MKRSIEKFRMFSFKRNLFNICSVIIAILFTGCLLYSVAFMPKFGDPNGPASNEVSVRYVEKGTEETGVINSIAGMILVYRGFDTFGEATILFVAVEGVVSMMRKKYNPEDEEEQQA